MTAAGIRWSSGCLAGSSQHRDRNLQADGVIGKTRDRIAARRIAECAQRPEFQTIEHRAEIDEERIVTLTGENLDSSGQIVNRP